MHLAGILSEDAPDPRLGVIEQLRAMPIPLLGLVPQPHVEDWGSFGVQSAWRDGVMTEMSATLSYTLWRNPADRADPANLADLDEATRRSLAERPRWPRPPWLIELVERMRFPTLWEVVRTVWRADPGDAPSVAEELVSHIDHVLANRYSPVDAADPEAWYRSLQERHLDHRVDHRIERGAPVIVDGASVEGVRIDSDPRVLGIGADLGAAGVLTAVFDRDALPMLTVEFVRRPLDVVPSSDI